MLAFLPDPSAAAGRGAGSGSEGGVAGGSGSGSGVAPGGVSESSGFERELEGVGGMSLGIISATQGQYSSEQFLLDISQGARISSSAYGQLHPPALSVRPAGAGAIVAGWAAARRRAKDAPQLLEPGLLASAITGGAAYAGISGGDDIDAIVAAGREGVIASFSLGAATTLLGRIAALGRTRGLVVADLPGGSEGRADLRALAAGRAGDRELIVLERPRRAAGRELLWAGIAGLEGGGGHELSSQTTNERGLIASVDLAPTILVRLHPGPPPTEMRGFAIRTDGRLEGASLRALLGRLEVIGARRLRALGFLLAAVALLLIAARASPAVRRRAIRIGGLGILWAPVAVLLPAAIEPGAAVEYATIVIACLALGALTDALVPWPRAPLVIAVAVIAVLVADALAGTQLLVRSLLGPDPALGARFYGIGNELKSGLAVLVFAAVAAALYPARRGRRAAAAMACATVLLAVVEGSARIGAGVGGVILVAAGGALASVLLLPAPGRGRRTVSRRTAVVVLSPLAGLLALAAIDLLSAHGSGQFTGSILHARSAADVRDIIVRRYTAAYRELINRAMPFATALALGAAPWGVAERARLLAPVRGDRGWAAALAGGLTAGVAGMLSEDSGPELLVVAVFALGCVLAYLWGRPERVDRASASPARSAPSSARLTPTPAAGTVAGSVAAPAGVPAIDRGGQHA